MHLMLHAEWVGVMLHMRVSHMRACVCARVHVCHSHLVHARFHEYAEHMRPSFDGMDATGERPTQ